MEETAITRTDDQKFWDEWFEKFLAIHDSVEMAGAKADEVLAIRRKHRIISPDELEAAQVEANRWRMEYNAIYARNLDAQAWVNQRVSEVLRQRDEAQGSLYSYRRIETDRDHLQELVGNLREALERYKWAELNPPAPAERLDAAVTIGDLSAAVNHPGGSLVGLIGLMQKWGINLADMIDEEFFSPTTGIMRVSDVDPQDSDTRRRLRKYLATGIYVKRVQEDPAE